MRSRVRSAPLTANRVVADQCLIDTMNFAGGYTQGPSNVRSGHAFGVDRTELYSDEGPPIGEVAAKPWAVVAFEIVMAVLTWNRAVAKSRRRLVSVLKLLRYGG